MDLDKKFTYRNDNNNRIIKKKSDNEIKRFSPNEHPIIKKGLITEKELIIYSRNKIIKDVDFAKNTIPYIRGYILFVGSVFFIGNFIWSRYYKNIDMSFGRMMLLNLADLEEVKS